MDLAIGGVSTGSVFNQLDFPPLFFTLCEDLLLYEVNSVLRVYYLLFPFPVPRYETYIDLKNNFGVSLGSKDCKRNVDELKYYTKNMMCISICTI